MQYELIRSDRRTAALEIREGKLIVRAPRRMPQAQIEAFVQKNQAWIDARLARARARQQALQEIPKLTQDEIRDLARQAARVIPARVAYFAPLVGVSYGRITIRCQRTRWGSCSSEGNLSFNCLLMLAPPEVLDSVVVHELCHRRQPNHSRQFYDEVLRVFPEYRRHQTWLKENGDALLARVKN